jgi:hypothetical protein
MTTKKDSSQEQEMTQEDERIKALSVNQDMDMDDAAQAIEDNDYLVLTDEEATEKAEELIGESLWAFNKSFLNCHSEAISEIPDKDFEAMQGKLCESFNKAVKAMIDDYDHFLEDAINCDGRGHFIASYDSEENEEKINQTYYYIYRLN